MRRTAVPTFEELYTENLDGVWRYVRSRVPDHHAAQDVTADAFARALRSWSTYDPAKGTVGAWLFRIAHHTVVDWWRRNRKDGRPREAPTPLETLDAEDGMPDPQDALIREETTDELRRAVGELSEREQEALGLRFGGRLKAKEVGEVLGISEGAAKMLVHRAVTKLRTVIAHDG